MGLMDRVILMQRLAKLRQDNKNFAGNQSRQDLLKRSSVLVRAARRLENLELVIQSKIQKADILNASGQLGNAILELQQCESEIEQSRNFHLKARVLAKLAHVLAMNQDWSMVSSTCEKGINLVEHNRANITTPYVQSAYLRSRISLYSDGVQAAWELKQYDLMMARAELSRSRFVLRYQDRHKNSVTQHSDLKQQFEQICAQVESARSKGQASSELLAKRRTLWDMLFTERFKRRTGMRSIAFDTVAVQATLAQDEAVLYYYWLDELHLLRVALDHKQVLEPILITLSHEQRHNLEIYAERILNSNKESSPSIGWLLDQQINVLSDLLLPCDHNSFFTEKKRLLISPHRLLHTLPFHALHWGDGVVIEHFAVSYIPNLSSLLIRNKPSVTQKILALGIRDYHIPETKLASLPDAEQEVEEISTIYNKQAIPVTKLRGSDGTADRNQFNKLLDEHELEQFSCLHIATHGDNVDSDTPMESHLALADSLLEGLEISNWELSSDIVILSACCSAQRPISGRGMQELPGDELFGLQAAFFAAGAKKLLGSLWPVNSAAARTIMNAFHRHLADGWEPERALQAAMCEFRTNILTRKTELWAPFFLFAMGRTA